PGIGELEKRAVTHVNQPERTWPYAKKRRVHRGMRITILRHGIERRNYGQTAGVRPGAVVGAQGLAVGIPDERRAVVDFDGPGEGRLEILRLGQPGEPAAKGLAVVWIVQPDGIGRAI